MKKITSFFCFYLPGFITLFSQNFAPFNSSVPKRFYNSNNVSDNSYFFYSDSTEVSTGTTTFYQYHSYQTPPVPIDPYPCVGWGGGGNTFADTTFLGNLFTYTNNTRELVLFNDQNDSVYFNFNLSMGDSSVFYDHMSDKYYIKLIQYGLDTIYGYQDSVKTFSISHYDSFNNLINSPLNGKFIRLGKQLGLISFIDCYNFPSVEKALELQGQQNPLIGSYQYTYDDIFPFDVGDSLQFTGFDNRTTQYNCLYLANYRVTNRIETATTVTIFLDHWFEWLYKYPPLPYDPPCNGGLPYSDTITFLKEQDFIGRPVDHILNPGLQSSLSSIINSWTYPDVNCSGTQSIAKSEMAEVYCDSCNCYIAFDGYMQRFTNYAYTVGLGFSYSSSWHYDSNPWYQGFTLTYYHVNGVECGTYGYLNTQEEALMNFILQPNPATDEIFINYEFDSVVIHNLQGALQLVNSFGSNRIDISGLSSGMYIAKFTIGQQVVTKKFIKM